MTIELLDDFRTGPLIYCLRLNGPTERRKVGYTANLKRRDAEISPKMPWPVELEMTYRHPLARKIEPIAHKIMADVRNEKSEWFSCDLGRVRNALAMATVCAAHKENNPKPKVRRQKRPFPKVDGPIGILRDRLEILCYDYRREHDVSERELAHRMGMRAQRLDKLLTLQIKMGFNDAKEISDFFGVSIAWLCGESEIRYRMTKTVQQLIKSLIEEIKAPSRLAP